MSDIEIQLESVSFQLHGLREAYNQEGITSCIKELESIKRKLQQASLNACYEDQQHELIEYYEKRYDEARQAIMSLERELEETKQNSSDFGYGNAGGGDVLIERKNFANNENHSLDLHSKHVLQQELESFKSMENELVEMEVKIHEKERENQEFKEQIKQLETSNKNYNEQVDIFMRQEEELTHKMEEYENKISKLNTQNKAMGKETWILKEENELLNSKVNLLEKQEEQIQKDVSVLEAKLKVIEKEKANLQSQVQELHEENIGLKEENANISQEFKTVFKDLKHQVTHHRTESMKHKTYKPVNHFYIKSEQNLSAELERSRILEKETDGDNVKSTKNSEGDSTAKADQEGNMTFQGEEIHTPNELQGIEHFNGSLSDFGRRSLQELPHNSSFHEEKTEKRNSIFFVDKSLFLKKQDKNLMDEVYKDQKKRHDCAANCNIF
jgi:chromosome segregation ATPase